MLSHNCPQHSLNPLNACPFACLRCIHLNFSFGQVCFGLAETACGKVIVENHEKL